MESTTSTLTADQRRRDMMRRLGDDIANAISIGSATPLASWGELTLADLTGTADQRESD